MTMHCGALFLKKEFINQIDLEYIYYTLHTFLKEYALGQNNKRITKEIIKDVMIGIPVINDKYDYKKQKEIASNYKQLHEVKNTLIQQLESFQGVAVAL